MVIYKYNQYLRDSFTKRGIIHSLTKSKTIPRQITLVTQTESSPAGKANLFNDFFDSNFQSVDSKLELPVINTFINPNFTTQNSV